jgi:hypothetical protein
MFSRIKKAYQVLTRDLRGIGPGMRASRLYGRALNLQKKGREKEAFDLIGEAIALLPDTVAPDGAATGIALSSLLVMTVSYTELAEKLGKWGAADVAIRRAIALATPHVENNEIQPYVNWLQSRLNARTSMAGSPNNDADS